MERGREVKRSLVPLLGALAGVWVCAMNEMERVVRSEARAAFESAFAPDKRQAMIAKYMDDISHYIFETINQIIHGGDR